MKRFAVILMLVTTIIAGGISTYAKTTKKKSKVRTSNSIVSNQWKGTYSIDDYTEEKTPVVTFFDESQKFMCQYNGQTLVFGVMHNVNDNFDLWWDANMDYNGEIEYESDICCNFIGNSPAEFCDEYSIFNMKDSDNPNLSLFFIIYDEDLGRLLKANNRVNILYYDIVDDRDRVLKLSLSGFSKACQSVGLRP